MSGCLVGLLKLLWQIFMFAYRRLSCLVRSLHRDRLFWTLRLNHLAWLWSALATAPVTHSAVDGCAVSLLGSMVPASGIHALDT